MTSKSAFIAPRRRMIGTPGPLRCNISRLKDDVTCFQHASTLPAAHFRPTSNALWEMNRMSSSCAAAALSSARMADRKSVVSGKSVSVRVDLGGRRFIKKQKPQQVQQLN